VRSIRKPSAGRKLAVLSSPPEQIERTKVLRTYLGGRLVFERK